MTGFVGYIGSNHLIEPDKSSISEMSGVIANSWLNTNCQLVLKVPQLNVGHESFENDRLCIDIYGDIFSGSGEKTSVSDWTTLIAEKYLSGNLNELVATLNGYFVFVIFDKQNKQLTIANDRYGLKPLYLWRENSSIAGFASEIKGLVLHPQCNFNADKSALETFVDVGHLLGQQTLFDNIERMPPATIITVDTLTNVFTSMTYWQWSNITKNDQITFDQAVDQLYSHFELAMKRCLATVSQQHIAITLSGGLDSRLLLAAAKKHFKGSISTYTFGEQGCDDAVIAMQVSELAQVSNQFVAINSDNWFEGREQGIWLTDGLKNVLHMHALSSVNGIALNSNYLLNGYLGDVTLGGSYLLAGKDANLPLDKKVAIRYGKHADKAASESSYFESSGNDPIFIYNRGVRFIAAGTDLLSHKLHNFKPFLDNDLVNFLYSLPDDFRRDGKLYHRMLLKYYPDYFLTIPWQQTGKPISVDSTAVIPKINPLKQFVIRALKGSPIDAFARKVYRKLSKKQHYVAYDAWLRLPEFRQYVNEVVLDENSSVCRLLSRQRVEKIVSSFYQGKAEAKPETIGSLLTLELYLSQLSKLKNSES